MPTVPLFDVTGIDTARTVAPIEEIRKSNPQRFEMEQLTRIVHANDPAGEVAGVLEIDEDPWWARGHIPGRPLMPGVLMLEALAQLCSYAVRRVYDVKEFQDRFFGFGGIDEVKFRGAILPGQTLLLLGKSVEIRSRRAVYDTQGWVDGRLCVEARITGMWV
ncbi:MAG TPA: 3-hydroxyacyl-ACP dehydratase FabZ family protein [Planctomycetota bacterium]|nr:3-hydroxyacyl-ACP dehydratase FabZ family protein [Planctomycetota bacterium]